MRRADRLFRIVQTLRGRRLTTAAHLAEELRVSPRTIYRDIRDLSLSGVPVDGEAGVGYRLRPGFDLPPMMFTWDEVEALTAGARMVEAWGGRELARAARSALAKIATTVPADKRIAIERTRLYVPSFHIDARIGAALDSLREAIGKRAIAELDYRDANTASSLRRVWPLGLYFWGSAWTLAAWCELRRDFRTFRLDRCAAIRVLGDTFPDVEGRRLADFIRHMEKSP